MGALVYDAQETIEQAIETLRRLGATELEIYIALAEVLRNFDARPFDNT